MTRPRVLVFGSFSPPGIPCGITASVNNFVASPITKSYDLELISTFRNADPSRGLVRRLAFGVELAATSAWCAVIHRADIIDVHTASGRDFLKNAAVILAARSIGRPVVLRIHGGSFDSVYGNAGPWGKKIIRGLLRLANRVVVLSHSWAVVVTRIQPQANVIVIPNSVDCQNLAVTSQRRPKSASAILLLGNLCANKGHFDTLEAAAIIVRSFPECRFLFAGAEREKGALRQLRSLAQVLGIKANVEFLGPIFGDAKTHVLARAGIFALPSHIENMPVSLMEAMAVGLPVIASRVGAIPEMVEDGRTGLLIDAQDIVGLADALLMLLRDSKRRHEMGKAGQKMATKRWDTQVVASTTETMYRGLL
jgi:glycosyltransferase involved in cell wall biosynthesis